MKRKLLVSLVIIILIGGMIISLMIKNSERKSYVTILNNKEAIDYFVVRFKNDSVKITDDNDVNLVCEMFDEKVKRNKSLDNRKGWIYKIIAMDSNDNQLETFIIIDDVTIKINDKIYNCKEINISEIDELTGIHR